MGEHMLLFDNKWLSLRSFLVFSWFLHSDSTKKLPVLTAPSGGLSHGTAWVVSRTLPSESRLFGVRGYEHVSYIGYPILGVHVLGQFIGSFDYLASIYWVPNIDHE